MDRKDIKEFLETLHFHGYIDHDITKLDNLIDFYPKQCDKPMPMLCDFCDETYRVREHCLCEKCRKILGD